MGVRVWELPDRVEIGVAVSRAESATDVLKRPVSVEFELEGETRKLSMPALINLRSHADESVRRRGYEAELAAWASVRGKPSSMKPPRQRRQALRSRTISQTVASGTKAPRRMYSMAAFIAGDWSQSLRLAAARNTSPVERWQHLSRCCRTSACVPLPMPGAPSSTRRQGWADSSGDSEHWDGGPCNHAARSFFCGFMFVIAWKQTIALSRSCFVTAITVIGERQ